MADPKGRVALITGASRGIGAAAARGLAAAGAHVVLWARTRNDVEKTAKEIRDAGGTVRADCLDLVDRERVTQTLRSVEMSVGPIDILVNNAGIAPTASLGSTTDELWDAVLNLNLRVPFFLSRLVIPGMKQRHYGRIVNVASTAGLRGYAYTAAYSASKHGLIGMTRAHSKECVPHGVTVNAVCPSFVDTPLTQDALRRVAEKTARTTNEIQAEFTRTSPIGRLIQPAEVVAAILYFVGPQTAATSGQALSISGGEMEG